jgi:hypothetical protein
LVLTTAFSKKKKINIKKRKRHRGDWCIYFIPVLDVPQLRHGWVKAIISNVSRNVCADTLIKI